MKNKLILCLLLSIFLSNCKNATTQNGSNDDEKVNVIAKNYYDERMKLFPFEAQSNGINDYNDQFPIDISDGFRDSLKRSGCR